MNAHPPAPEPPTAFRIECGRSDAGWCSFALTLHGRVFEAAASYLGAHPLSVLVPLVVELHEHYTAEPWIDGAPDAEVDVHDEPGGLRLGFFPLEYPLVRVRVWEAVDLLVSGTVGELLGEHVVGFETIAREVHREAGRVLGRQGLTESGGWGTAGGTRTVPRATPSRSTITSTSRDGSRKDWAPRSEADRSGGRSLNCNASASRVRAREEEVPSS